jgi:hypothetical protein
VLSGNIVLCGSSCAMTICIDIDFGGDAGCRVLPRFCYLFVMSRRPDESIKSMYAKRGPKVLVMIGDWIAETRMRIFMACSRLTQKTVDHTFESRCVLASSVHGTGPFLSSVCPEAE